MNLSAVTLLFFLPSLLSNNAFLSFADWVVSSDNALNTKIPQPLAGAYVQWRAKAIGEKGAAAEAKLEQAGPFEGMTIRRAMAAVLKVLKDVLEDDFSTERLEMVCVNLCDANGAGGELASAISSDGGVTAKPLVGEEGGGTSLAGDTVGGSSSRKSGGRENSSHILRNDDSPAASTASRRYRGLFRRVSKSEMEDMLLGIEEPEGI